MVRITEILSTAYNIKGIYLQGKNLLRKQNNNNLDFPENYNLEITVK